MAYQCNQVWLILIQYRVWLINCFHYIKGKWGCKVFDVHCHLFMNTCFLYSLGEIFLYFLKTLEKEN